MDCEIHPTIKITKPRLTAAEPFDIHVEMKKAKLIMAHWKRKKRRKTCNVAGAGVGCVAHINTSWKGI
jgi:hypothetical protein